MRLSDRGRKPGLMRRLLRSDAGNIGIMTAALIVPLVGMVGSGVDFSRYFLVKQRLQLACDAGALAGRKAMNNTTFTATAKKEAERLFDANFVEHSYSSTNLKREFTEADGVVSGTASVDIDTAILQIMDIDEFDIQVDCGSKLDLPNTDIMFVLDTTGSMATVDSGSKSRLKGLQEAVQDFSITIQQAMGPKSQVRYGFVPYSSNVNVGHLLRRDWMRSDVDIESREAVPDGFDTTSNEDSRLISGDVNSGSTNISRCSNQRAEEQSVPAPAPTTTTQSDGTVVTVTKQRKRYNGTTIECKNGRDDYWVYSNAVYETTRTDTSRPRFTWQYKTVNYDENSLIGPAGGTMASPGTNSVQLPVGNMSSNRPTNATVRWDGCIRELKTREITDFSAMPTDVQDFNINHIPTNAAESRWRMWLPRLQFQRGIYAGGGGLYGSLYTSEFRTDTNYVYVSEYENYGWAACPTPARALSKMSVGDVQSYIVSLRAVGGTYHDVGLTWGGRLISPEGIYGSINEVANEGGAVSRHVIFMTDGDTAPNAYIMSSHGQEYLRPQRGNFNNLKGQIEGRMQLICQQIRSTGATLWVVAFGPDTNNATRTNLKNCASEGSYFTASGNDELSATFQLIAQRVAELRLVD